MQSLFALLIAALLLSGCVDESEQTRQLHTQVSELRQQLHDQGSIRKAELDYLEKQASIAAACESLPLSLCTDSLVAPGQAAQAGGIGGGTGYLYWLVVGLQCALYGVFVAALLIGLQWGWVRLLEPAESDVVKAKQLVSTANEQAAQARERMRQASEDEKLSTARIELTQVEQVKLEAQCSRMKDQIAALKDEIEQLIEIQKQLSVFD